ncbi:MAG: hypothetical protein RL060_1290, partial [Bacteroidota bacterium]
SLSFGEGWGEAFELLYILMRLPWVNPHITQVCARYY